MSLDLNDLIDNPDAFMNRKDHYTYRIGSDIFVAFMHGHISFCRYMPSTVTDDVNIVNLAAQEFANFATWMKKVSELEPSFFVKNVGYAIKYVEPEHAA